MEPINQKERLIELRANGLSLQAIATELGISKQTVINWTKELNTEIQNAKALSLDALYEKHWMSKKARIEMLGGQLSKIREELAKRNFDDVPTDKLMDMQIKLLSAMKHEKDSLVLVTEERGFDVMESVTRHKLHKIDN